MTSPRRLRIAMVGQKGLPATWGGIERHVEEVGTRLAARGHEVTVFSRRNYAEHDVTEYRGMKIVNLRTVNSKHLEAILHAASSSLRCATSRFDVVHYHGVGTGLVAPIVRVLRPGTKVVLTSHGLDGERAKWGGPAQMILNAATWMSAHVPHNTVVVSQGMADYYRATYGTQALPIVNGVNVIPRRESTRYLDRLGIEAGKYALFVGRLVPEKSPDTLIEAFRKVPGDDLRLVLAGGSSHTDDFVSTLHRLAADDPRVILPGYVHGEDLEEIYSHAGVFVIPSVLEGLPLTLLEAISYRLPVVASAIPPHVEVLKEDGPGGRLFETGDVDALAKKIEYALTVREQDGADALQRRIIDEYSWDRCADELEAMYYGRPVVTPVSPTVVAPASITLPDAQEPVSH